jgi:hypothetical protein
MTARNGMSFAVEETRAYRTAAFFISAGSYLGTARHEPVHRYMYAMYLAPNAVSS